MKKILFTLSLLVVTLATQSQTNLDSLNVVWQDQTQPDTTRLKAIKKLAWDGYLFSQPDSAFYYAQLQYDFAESKGIKKQMADALNTQGVSFAIKGDYPQSLNYFQRQLKIVEEIGDKSGIASALNSIGNIHTGQGNYPQALNYYQRSLKIQEELEYKKGIATSLNNIGIIYNDQGDYPQALNYFQRSIKIQEEIGDKRGIAASLNNIGTIYQYQIDYPQALKYYQRSLKIYEEIGDKIGIARALNNIGAIYNEQGDHPQALNIYQRSLKVQEEIGNKIGIAASLNNIGTIYQEQGDYPQALNYYQRSLKIREEIGDKNGIPLSLNNIGSIYKEQGDHFQALDYCQRSYELAVSIGALEIQKNGCRCLYDAYKAMGNGNKALEYHELLSAVEDSLNTEETAKNLQQMEFTKQVLQDSIATAEKERLVLEAHQEEIRVEEKTRNISIGIGAFFVLLAGGFFMRWRYVKKSKAIIEEEKDRSNNLLLNILPADIAEELKIHGKAEARDFDMVSILFTDFKGFTEASAKLSASELVTEINHCFEAFDHIMEKYTIEKIKTIGDAYMAAGGLPVPADDSIKNTVLAALEMQAFITSRKATQDAQNKPAFEMRVGIHTGPVVAGIVGVKKFQYDIWGDTVNTASRMESSGEVGKVNISQVTYNLLKDDSDFSFESRGKIEAKGKGEIEMYFVAKN